MYRKYCQLLKIVAICDITWMPSRSVYLREKEDDSEDDFVDNYDGDKFEEVNTNVLDDVEELFDIN